jgi:hypothetical protein
MLGVTCQLVVRDDFHPSLLYPLLKSLPPIYRWRVRRRIYR